MLGALGWSPSSVREGKSGAWRERSRQRFRKRAKCQCSVCHIAGNISHLNYFIRFGGAPKVVFVGGIERKVELSLSN